jgi:3-oxoacyl-[acyl-carrier protein] reductase
MTQQLEGKIAIVTGAAGGFGEGIARLFVAEGAKVLIADLDGDKAHAVAASLGPNARAVRCDVSQRSDIDAALRACIESFGEPDIVVNNAGTTHRNQSMLEVDEATFDRVFAVNVKSIYHMTQAVVPLMKRRKSGCIVNIGSTAGIRPRPGLSWYNASKGAVNVLSKSMAAELGADGIRVNAVCPVMGATGLIEQFLGTADTPEARARVVAGIPLGRLSTPEDVAQAALYLASDAGRFITGIELPVDGGRCI